MHPLYLYDMGKKIYPNTLVLVKTDDGYISDGEDLKILNKHIGIYPIPESLIEEVRAILSKHGHKTSIAATKNRPTSEIPV